MSSNHSKNSRRMFRGRGNFQDGNLPQKPHRNKRPQRRATKYVKPDDQSDEETNIHHPGRLKYDEECFEEEKVADENDATETQIRNETATEISKEREETANEENQNETLLSQTTKHVKPDDQSDEDRNLPHLDNVDYNEEIFEKRKAADETCAIDTRIKNETRIKRDIGFVDNKESMVSDEHENAANEEIKQLMKRVHNIQKSIQSSTKALLIPSTWRENCLNPVCRSCKIWSTILRHYDVQYETISMVGSECKIHSESIKDVSLNIYVLVQLAMQTGPLTGSNPGYFKRCGAEVADMAQLFLKSIMEEKCFSFFTEKQTQNIKKWRANAQKAVENKKPPSKVIMKQRLQGKRK